MIDKQEIIEIIENEIEDRSVQADQSECPSDYDNEIQGLNDMKTKVVNGSDLSYDECEWLCGLVKTHVEIDLDV